MIVRFVLAMENVVVGGERFDSVTIDWEEGDLSHSDIMVLSEKWIRTPNILTSRMNGLNEVKESSLTIEPVFD